MTKPLIIFLCFITLFTSQNHTLAPQIEPPLSRNGEVTLYPTETGGFYVQVSFIDKDNNPNDIPSTGAMIPAFYTSDTLLVKKCFDFSPYNCADYECKLYDKDTLKSDYLNFHAEGYPARTRVYLDYLNWDLYSFALIANKCYSQGVQGLGSEMYGILGLGADAGSIKNYIGSQVFSIYLGNDGKSGKLLFNWNSDYAESDTPASTLSVDRNWQVHDIDFMNIGGAFVVISKASSMFDLSSDVIRVPHYIYSAITYFLQLRYGIDCSSPNESLPVCTINNQIKNLPEIAFYSGHYDIPLPPQLYVKDGFNDSVFLENVTLNIQSISADTTQDFIYVLPQYQYHIILGNSFFRYYYTKFDIEKSRVVLYKKREIESSSPSFWIYITLGLILLCLAICFCLKFLKKEPQNKAITKNAKVDVESNSQVPLILN